VTKKLTSPEKSRCDSSRLTYAHPNALSRSTSTAESIDVSDRREIWLEGIEISKSDANRVTKILTFPEKIDLRIESPDLRQSKSIVAIRIECGID